MYQKGNRFSLLRNANVIFCTFVCLSNKRLIFVDAILRFMSHFVESKAENYEKQSTAEFRQSLRKYSILKMVRFFVFNIFD